MKIELITFRTVLEKLSPLPKKNPNPTGPSFSRSAPIAQKAVEITSSPNKSRLKNLKKISSTKPNNKKKHKKETGDDSWFCLLCEETKEDEMIQCMKCRAWIHTRCGGVSAATKRFFFHNCR